MRSTETNSDCHNVIPIYVIIIVTAGVVYPGQIELPWSKVKNPRTRLAAELSNIYTDRPTWYVDTYIARNKRVRVWYPRYQPLTESACSARCSNLYGPTWDTHRESNLLKIKLYAIYTVVFSLNTGEIPVMITATDSWPEPLRGAGQNLNPCTHVSYCTYARARCYD